MGVEAKAAKPFADPASSTEHLTPGGKHRHKRVNKDKQKIRYEQLVDDSASSLIPKDKPEPGDNLKVKPKPVIGIDND